MALWQALGLCVRPPGLDFTFCKFCGGRVVPGSMYPDSGLRRR
jgi:hypothetical protein